MPLLHYISCPASNLVLNSRCVPDTEQGSNDKVTSACDFQQEEENGSIVMPRTRSFAQGLRNGSPFARELPFSISNLKHILRYEESVPHFCDVHAV